MLPADQRLNTCCTVVEQADLRLIEQSELISFYRFVDFFLDSEVLENGVVHLFREKLEIITALLFGRVHGQVSIFHQHIGVGGVIGRHGDADTDGGKDVLTFDANWFRHGAQNLLCNGAYILHRTDVC